MGRYDPKKVLITFAGIPLTGFADGTYISIKRASDDYKNQVGAQGHGTRVRLHDKSATMELTLKHDVVSNAALSAFRVAGLALGDDVGPWGLLDLLTGETQLAGEAWIQRAPDVEHGVDAGNRTWTFATLSMDVEIGGSIAA